MSADVEMVAQEGEGTLVQSNVPSYPDVVDSIAMFLANKVRAHDLKFQTTKNPKTYFTSSFPPQITIDHYLFHLMRHVRTAPGVVVYMLIYIEKIIGILERKYQKQTKQNVPFLMTSYNAHRLVLTAFLLAHKYWEDLRYNTSMMAKIGGIEPKELLKLEREFLKFVKFELYVSEGDFIQYHNAALLYGREMVSQSRA
jgi:hypothetical protein